MDTLRNVTEIVAIPVDEIDDPDPTCLLAHEVEEGQQYYIICTTLGGLYRYDINDIVEVPDL